MLYNLYYVKYIKLSYPITSQLLTIKKVRQKILTNFFI